MLAKGHSSGHSSSRVLTYLFEGLAVGGSAIHNSTVAVNLSQSQSYVNVMAANTVIMHTFKCFRLIYLIRQIRQIIKLACMVYVVYMAVGEYESSPKIGKSALLILG
jgi:hypothetical protein